MSVRQAPRAVATYGGKPPAHIIIHGIGTPPTRDRWARANSSRDSGCVAAKESSSVWVSLASAARSIIGPR